MVIHQQGEKDDDMRSIDSSAAITHLIICAGPHLEMMIPFFGFHRAPHHLEMNHWNGVCCDPGDGMILWLSVA